MNKILRCAAYGGAVILACSASAAAQVIPKVSVEVGQATKPGDLSATLQIVILMTVLALAPSILMMVTSFVRIAVVLSFLRHAIGTQQMPPNQLLLSLALILTFFIMAPVGTKSYQEGIKPYLDEKITKEEAWTKTVTPFRTFMLAQTREQDLGLFVNLSGIPAPKNADDIPLHVLVPGFVISELRTSFQIAFVIFIPFLVIDMVVSAVLMSMGMLMLPPVLISLPFKLLLFVLADGWHLVVMSLLSGFA